MSEQKEGEASVEEKASSITDYLQAPRRKRKNYVIMALGQSFDPDLAIAMDSYVKKNYAQLATSQPATPADLSRQFGRNISLLVIEDQFAPLEDVIELVKTLKKRRHNEVIPVLFLTKNPKVLVEAYHKHLLAYHEADEYLYYPGLERYKVFSRIKIGIDTKNRRRSRRYKVDLPISFFHLEADRFLKGKIVDLSIHGTLLQAEDDCLFREGDQLKISIPITNFLPLDEGEFLKISAKVRRVFISGNVVGASFEYMSEKQVNHLSQLVIALMQRDMERKSVMLKMQLARKPEV